jgi:hypothetical protein
MIPSRVLFFSVTALALLIPACTEQPVNPSGQQPSFAEAFGGAGEPEVFGNVYENGQRSIRTDLTVTIEALDPATQSRLRGRIATTMWANPNTFGPNSHPKGWAYGWFDPRAANNCGTLGLYLQGNNDGRLPEAHWTNAITPPDTTLPEGHCIRPGRYRLTLSGDGVMRSVEFEYVAARTSGGEGYLTTIDGETGNTLLIEPQAYSDADVWTDHVIHVDLTASTAAPSPVLRIQNSHSSPFTGNFVPDTSLAANEVDWVRFSSLTSTGIIWNLSSQGRALALYRYDMNRPGGNPPTPYFVDDRNAVPLLRLRRFDDVRETRPVVVGLQLMQPNNLADQLPVSVQRTIQFTRLTPVACAHFERTTTWRLTDQVLSAGCSTLGPSIRYRWQFEDGGPWTAYSPDTLYDYFEGHSAAGPHTVTVQARDISTGASSTSPFTFSVASDQLLMTGRTYVTDKARNPYVGFKNDMLPGHRYPAYWFEHYEPGTPWWPASGPYPQDSIARIWYAGDYTVDLREQDSTANLLARSRLHIRVCNPSCGELAAPLRAPAAISPALADWGLFGAGPWLSWSTGNALRFYDLVGAHDLPNRFTDINWLDAPGGQASTTGAGSYLSSSQRALQTPDARAVAFALAPPDARVPFTFGFALDPDLGPNAADDQTGYDAARGMVYVFDQGRAVGFLLRDSRGRNALQSVTQYGLQRRSPLTGEATQTAMRARQINLLPGRSDVQLLLTAPAQAGQVTWTLVLVRGGTVGDLRTRADAALAELASNQ